MARGELTKLLAGVTQKESTEADHRDLILRVRPRRRHGRVQAPKYTRLKDRPGARSGRTAGRRKSFEERVADVFKCFLAEQRSKTELIGNRLGKSYRRATRLRPRMEGRGHQGSGGCTLQPAIHPPRDRFARR